jgi:hypothetical protein
MTSPPKKNQKPASSFLKYSSLGFQLFGLLGVALYLGLKVDKYLNWTEVPVFTMIFLLIVFVGFMYKLIKELGEK